MNNSTKKYHLSDYLTSKGSLKSEENERIRYFHELLNLEKS